MASYSQFEAYVRKNYKILSNEKAPKGFFALGFNLPGGRSHILMVSPGVSSDALGETANLMAAVGKLSGSKLQKALEMSFDLPMGGLVAIDDAIFLRHVILLDNVDENEIDAPFLAITFCADRIEEATGGGDRL